MAIPVRLFLFSGYGLGDDPNFVAAAVHFLERGLDLSNYYHNRLLFLFPEVISFSILGINEVSFVLPIFLAAIGTHLLLVVFSAQAMGARFASFVSVLCLSSPFETLTSTAFAVDYHVSLYLVAAALCCLRGYRESSRSWMIGGGLCLACTALVTPSVAALLAFVLATVTSGHAWRRWRPFWVTLGGLFLIYLLTLLALGAEPWHTWWSGHPRGSISIHAFAVYPRLLLLQDRFGNWMFGMVGWLAILGLGIACVSPRRSPGASLVALCGSYVAAFLIVAGLSGHQLIFRYLAQVAPALYFCAAFPLESLYDWHALGRSRALALTVLGLAGAFGAYQTPAVSEPSRDPNSDGRALTSFLAGAGLPSHVTIHGDSWTCERVRWMLLPMSSSWNFRCGVFKSVEEKKAFLKNLGSGYLITGGGSLAWYSTRKWVLNLEETAFVPPRKASMDVAWQLMLEVDRPPKPWRREPLRIWRIAHAQLDAPVEIPDPALGRCLREAVFPDTSDDEARPIPRWLARRFARVECVDAGIRDTRGLEHFGNVEELILSGNQLKVIDLSPFEKARIVLLNSNELQRVDGLEAAPKLEVLWLSRNQLREVDLGESATVKHLKLDGNLLDRVSGRVHPASMISLWGNPGLDCAVATPFRPEQLRASGCGRDEGQLVAAVATSALEAVLHNEIAWLLGNYGHPDDREEAFAHARYSLKLDTQAHTHDTLGFLNYLAGNPKAALDHYDAALRLNDRYHFSYRGRAEVRLALGDLEGALSDYRTYGKLAPSQAERLEAQNMVRSLRAR